MWVEEEAVERDNGWSWLDEVKIVTLKEASMLEPVPQSRGSWGGNCLSGRFLLTFGTRGQWRCFYSVGVA